MVQVVTLGETMLRLSVSPGRALEEVDTLGVDIAGAESNVAIGLSRLGISTCWISRLVDNHIGRRIASTLRRHAVDISGVLWTAEGRNAVYFIEPGLAPRLGQVLYDRAASAFALINPNEVRWELLEGARLLHLTGITPALSRNCRTVVERAMKEARERGVPISFDLNYRARLWSKTEAKEVLSGLLPAVQILFCAERDARHVLKLDGTAEQIVTQLREHFGIPIIVITEGRSGATADDRGKLLCAPAPPVNVVDRIGSGDAFAAGFLYGWLQAGVEAGLRYGIANAALKMSYLGDISWATREELEGVSRESGPETWR